MPIGVPVQEQVIKYFVQHGATTILTGGREAKGIPRSESQSQSVPLTSNFGFVLPEGVLTQLTSKELPLADELSLCSCLVCCAALCSYDQRQRDTFLQENGVKVLTLLMYQMIYEPAHRRHLNPM